MNFTWNWKQPASLLGNKKVTKHYSSFRRLVELRAEELILNHSVGGDKSDPARHMYEVKVFDAGGS